MVLLSVGGGFFLWRQLGINLLDYAKHKDFRQFSPIEIG